MSMRCQDIELIRAYIIDIRDILTGRRAAAFDGAMIDACVQMIINNRVVLPQ